MYLIKLCDGMIGENGTEARAFLPFDSKSSATRYKRVEEGWKQLQLESGAVNMGVD